MKTEGEEGGADVDGDLLDDVDVASPVQIDTGGVDVFRMSQSGWRGPATRHLTCAPDRRQSTLTDRNTESSRGS